MYYIFTVLFQLSVAQMTNSAIEDLVAANVISKGLYKKMPACSSIKKGKELTKCVKKQFWMDLNSNSMGKTYKHSEELVVTVYQDKDSTSDVTCAYEFKVDPLKKRVVTNQTDWKCWGGDEQNEPSTVSP